VDCGSKGYVQVIIRAGRTWMYMVVAMISCIGDEGSPTWGCLLYDVAICLFY